MKNTFSSNAIHETEFTKLNNQIENCFLNEPGPGALPEKRNNSKKKISYIVPNYFYNLSGYSSAWAFKNIAEEMFKDLYIIISHNTTKNSFILIEDIQTPLGIAITDKQFSDELVKLTNIAVRKTNKNIDDISNQYVQNKDSEDIINLTSQLPFLQYAMKDKLNFLRTAYISLGTEIEYEQLIILKNAIENILKNQNKTTTYICASNLVHFGPDFNYVPFKFNIKESIENIDYKAIDLISKKESKKLIEFVEKESTTIYGYKAISLLIELSKNSEKSNLLEYYTTDLFKEINTKKDENENSVSFLSFEFN